MTTWEGPSLEATPGIGALTLGGFLREVCATHADQEAVVFDDPLRGGATTRWTYRDLAREARTIAAGLIARGVGHSTRVGIVMGNRAEMVASIFGIALAGGVAVPLSTFSTPAELRDVITRSAVAGVLTQARLGHRALGDEIAALVSDPGFGFLGWSAAVGEASWQQLATDGARFADAIDARAAAITPGDPALIQFSSGTTAAPKGMLHCHRAPTVQFWLQAGVFRRTPTSRVWAPLPLFWTAGFTTAMGGTLAGGGCFVLQEMFEAGAALRLLSRERVTEPYTLPHQARTLAEHPDWEGTDLSALREVYGKSVFTRHPSVQGDTTWNFPVGYGMSETCAIIATHYWDASRDDRTSSTGRLMPGVRMRVLDPETGRQLGPGEEGELAVTGPTLMDRYVGRTRAESLDADGFFHTGDTGHVDADGWVHWSGRRTEMIKTAGANVSPAELEVALRACALVRRARVIGLPDERLGEVVTLCVEPADGTDPTADDLRAFLAERVAAYKVPRLVVFFAPGELPTTGGDTKVRDDALITLVLERQRTASIPATEES